MTAKPANNIMQTQNDTLHRLLTMLLYIPQYPSQITARELTEKLESEGFSVSKRTVERDLLSLSEIFPLISNERSRPYGWGWSKDADPLFDAVKQLILKLRLPSISLIQRKFRVNYTRAADMLDAMEGDIVTPKDETGFRKMIEGETKKDESITILSPDWIDGGMRNFDNLFFCELANLTAPVKSIGYLSPHDAFRLRLSVLHDAAGVHISDDFVRITREFVITLSMRSNWRYEFELDFRLRPKQVYSYSKGKSGRKQFYIGFDALSQTISNWGVSIGIGFDFRNEQGISPECVHEYESFMDKVNIESALFDNTFGPLGGYVEPSARFKGPTTSKSVLHYSPKISDEWLFFGRRLTAEDIAATESLNSFVDECILVFDAISNASF